MVGAGAAGLATAIFLRRRSRRLSVVVLDGAARPGAKILVSGGSRCNVTNVAVEARDFWGGRRSTVRRVLAAFPASAAEEFFRGLGVPLHEEADGKLFPDSNRARDVLEALLRELHDVGADLRAAHRVTSIQPAAVGFRLVTPRGDWTAARVVLATGGLSLPKSGSDGAGLHIAAALGHSIVPTTPALAPFVLDEREPLHAALQGVAHPAELTLWIDGRAATRQSGALLWTHFGVSGPVALNMSRHWLRAALHGRQPAVTMNIAGAPFQEVETRVERLARERPKATVRAALGAVAPAAVAVAVAGRLAPAAVGATMAHLSRDDRRLIVRALVEYPLPVVGSRGYRVAEATAGGVSLDEIDPATMESRVQRGLFLVGEMLDVDGRLGGFNFQWAWSSAFIAARALASSA